MQLTNYKADSLGILSAILCLAHCLILPLLILGGITNETWVPHTQWMDFLFILLSAVAVFFAVRQTESNLIKKLMWGATLWFSASVILHDIYVIAIYSSMLASVALLLLHTVNFRHHQLQQHSSNATA